MNKNGLVLEYVSDRLRNDFNIVRLAVRENPEALKFASKKLQNDEEIMKLL